MTNRSRRPPNRVRAALLAALVLGIGVQGAASPAQASPDPARDGISNLAACYSQNGKLAIELVIDESRSLRKYDKAGHRVELAQAISEAMSQIASVPINGNPGQIEVRAVGFGSKMSDEDAPWRRLDRSTADEIAEDLERFRERDDQEGTDYVEALSNANADVVSHSAEMGKGDSSSVCRAVVWFTDGKFDFAADGYRPGWAPDISIRDSADKDEALNRGKALLCQPGGIADQLRSGEVYLLTAGLLSKAFTKEQEQLLRSVTEGDDGCGQVPGSPTGRYYSSNDVARLIREILPSFPPVPKPQPGDCPARKTCVRSFDVGEATVAVSLLVYPRGQGPLRLQSPSGERIDLRPRKADATADGAVVTSRPAGSSRMVWIDLRKAGRRGVGTWEVRFTPTADPASLTIWPTLRTGISLRAEPPDPWTRGEEGSVTFHIVDSKGRPLSPDAIGSVDLQARVTHGADKQGPIPLEPVPGTSDVVLRAAPGVDERASSASVTVAGNVMTAAGEVTLVGARITIPVTVPGAPQPAPLDLGVLRATRAEDRADDHSQPVQPMEVHRFLTVQGAADSGGRFCLASSSKVMAGTAVVVVRPEGERCHDVGRGQKIEVPVVVTVAEPASGPFTRSVASTVTSGLTQEEVDVDVPVRGDLVVPPGEPWVDKGLLGLLLSLGLGLLVFVWLAVSWWASRFNDTISLMQATKVAVTVRPSGTSYEMPELLHDQWKFLAAESDRRATVDDLVIRAPIRIFRAQDAIVSRAGHLVHGPLGAAGSRDGRIAHQVQGQWAFTVAEGTVPNQDAPVLVGELYFFVHEDALTMEAESGGLLDRAQRELTAHLPEIVKRLGRTQGSIDDPVEPPEEPAMTRLM